MTFREYVAEAKINYKNLGKSLSTIADKKGFKSIAMAVINNSSIEMTGDVKELEAFNKLINDMIIDSTMYSEVSKGRLTIGNK